MTPSLFLLEQRYIEIYKIISCEDKLAYSLSNTRETTTVTGTYHQQFSL